MKHSSGANNKDCFCGGPCISRCFNVFFFADFLHPPGRCGGKPGALLVLLVTRLVPVARRHLSLPSLLQLRLRIVPTLHP